jgi:hypothetical protein
MADLLGYDSPVFRVYEERDCDPHGYPWEWSTPTTIGNVGTIPPIKDLVRELAGHRCVRCGHPYRKGQEQFWAEPAAPESMVETAALALFDAEPVDEPRVKRAQPVHWSPCDERCTHSGPLRIRAGTYERFPWQRVGLTGEPAGVLVARGWSVQAAWRILTVHHLTGVKRDCRWGNLAPLCQRCHLTIQRTVVMDRVWPFEHDEWFKVYAAWWYALKYRGEDLRRSETEERMDELLALERIA